MRRIVAPATLAMALALAAPSFAHTTPLPPTTIDSLTTSVSGSTVSLSGTATLNGVSEIVGEDAAGDNPGGPTTGNIGIDLLEAGLSQATPTAPLVFMLELSGLEGGGIPETVSYNWDFKVDGTLWRVTTMRTRALVTTNAEPYGALFTCVPGAGGTSSCTQNQLLTAVYDEANAQIRVSLPLGLVEANPGSEITAGANPAIGIAATAFGRASVTNVYDTMTVGDFTIPSTSALLGLVPAGSAPSYSSGVSVNGSSFGGSVTAPGPGSYDAVARVCFGTNCGTATAPVTVG